MKFYNIKRFTKSWYYLYIEQVSVKWGIPIQVFESNQRKCKFVIKVYSNVHIVLQKRKQLSKWIQKYFDIVQTKLPLAASGIPI